MRIFEDEKHIFEILAHIAKIKKTNLTSKKSNSAI